MEFEEVVQGRRSIRGYKPDPVPRKVLEEVVELATRAPSSMNTQPWHLYIVTGEPLDRIRKANTERNLAGVPPSREIRSHGAYEGVHRQRQVDIAVQLFQAMGIERNDTEGRQDWVLRKHAGIPDDQVIMICVAMGYPDDDFAANHVRSHRRPVDEVASFVGLESS